MQQKEKSRFKAYNNTKHEKPSKCFCLIELKKHINFDNFPCDLANTEVCLYAEQVNLDFTLTSTFQGKEKSSFTIVLLSLPSEMTKVTE